MDFRKIFSERLSALRKNKGISLAALGEYLSVTDEAVRLLEKGKRSPSFEVLCALADYFDVPLDYLVGNDYSYNLVKTDGGYGIARQDKLKGEIVLVPNISSDKYVVMELIDKMNKYQLSPQHVLDFVIDELSSVS